MKTALIITAVLITLGSEATMAVTVDRADLNCVIACMQTRSCRNTLLVKDYYGGDFGRQIVFTERGQRYTFLLNWGDNSLSIWVRPEGTTDQASVSTFTDMGMDGNADCGFAGSAQESRAQRKFFSKMAPSYDSRGIEFQDYWNDQYAAAINAAVRKLCSPTPPTKKRPGM